MDYDINTKYSPEYLRDMVADELFDLLLDAKQGQFELLEQCSLHGRTKVVEKPHLFKKIRKDIARIRTILHTI